MMKMEMLPAGHGDCLWIEYGDPRRPWRVLIDGGAAGTYKHALRPKLLALPANERRFELLVITHIDADHITGVLEMLKDPDTCIEAKDIWFNGFRHLPDEAPDSLGAVQGEKLTQLLVRPGVSWNSALSKRAVAVPVVGSLPRVALAGGLTLTLLSPSLETLAALKPKWDKEVRKAGLDPSCEGEAETAEGFELLGVPNVDALVSEPFFEDSAEANGSSIAVLAEFEGRSIVLTGDSHPSVITAAIKRLEPTRLDPHGKLAVDACKLPHHASKANVSKDLLAKLDCRQYLFSTNGAHFKHPIRRP